MLHAYLLHSRPYRESSRLVDVFTAEYGRQSAVWRAGRRSQVSLQLFQPLWLELAGDRELKTLRQAEPVGLPLPLAGVALFSAFYVNEITARLLPRDEPQSGLFVEYAHVLGALSEGVAPSGCLRRYERALLDVLGYGLDFSAEAETGMPLLPAQTYVYVADKGFVRASKGFRGDLLLQLASGVDDTPDAIAAAKHIHRVALSRLLGSKPLKSRELFSVSRQAEGREHD